MQLLKEQIQLSLFQTSKQLVKNPRLMNNSLVIELTLNIRLMIPTIVCDFPVPGGPWIRQIRLFCTGSSDNFAATQIAFFCEWLYSSWKITKDNFTTIIDFFFYKNLFYIQLCTKFLWLTIFFSYKYIYIKILINISPK